ncbi:hypothetical protein GE09DRAFT_563383 [Coniochaeta sp. 2T2.1]|nr:hypothetical protein GE09DRAFT_563383 [Coniochaeta sp. 2T2.1]
MHLINALLTLALATLAVAAPPHFPEFPQLGDLTDLPKGCPKYCDCEQYTDAEDVFECQTNVMCEQLCWVNNGNGDRV